jgi:rod shape-determining protein MreD
MMQRHANWLIIPITFIIAFILTLLPMPTWTIWLRPAWILLILIYWAIVLPERVSIGTAWIAGLFLDVLDGTLLGEHALALSIVIYLVDHFHTRLRMYPLLQQVMSIFLLVLFYQFILYGIQWVIGSAPSSSLYWMSSVTSMLLWPWVYYMMRDRVAARLM